MGDELPDLIKALRGRLGEIVAITVNWSELQSSPDLNSFTWQRKQQRLMTITGRDAKANLLVVPYLTNTALAIMLLRQAAALPVDSAHCETKAFQTAECIVRAARAEKAAQTKSATLTREHD
jgi:Family of unknown function (DUF5994)